MRHTELKTKDNKEIKEAYLEYNLKELKEKGIVYIYNFNKRKENPFYEEIKELSRSQYNRLNAYIENKLKKKHNSTSYIQEEKEFFLNDITRDELEEVYNILKTKDVFNKFDEENHIWYYDDRNMDIWEMYKTKDYKSIQQEIYNIVYDSIKRDYYDCVKGIMTETTYLNIIDFINDEEDNKKEFLKISKNN
jgi:hypothetical protein